MGGSLVVLALLAAPAVLAGAPVVEPRVVASYPHDPAAFTQGLAFAGGVLYESTGLYGKSSVRRVDLRSGRPLAQRALGERLFGEGLTLAGGRVIQVTWRARVGFVRDPATLAQTATFRYDGEGWGLAFDGARLVLSDGTDVLRFLDPHTFVVTGELPVRDDGEAVAWLNELEFVDGLLYANVWRSTRIARIDPATGNVRDWIELAGLVPAPRSGAAVGVANGIAHDPGTGRLFVTGKLWPRLYEIEVPAPAR